VVRERLKLSGAMTTAAARRKETVEIYGLDGPPLSVTHDTGEWPTGIRLASALYVIEQFNKLAKRNLAPARWSKDGCDLTSLDPTIQRRPRDPQ
jgi:hypothetical protein